MTNLPQTQTTREVAGETQTQQAATEAQQEQVKLTSEQISAVNKQVLPSLRESDDLKELVDNHPGLMKFLFKIMDAYFPDLKLGEHFKSKLSRLPGSQTQERGEALRKTELFFQIKNLTQVKRTLNSKTDNRAFSLHPINPPVKNLKILNFGNDNLLKEAMVFFQHTNEKKSQLLIVEGKTPKEKAQAQILRAILIHKGSGIELNFDTLKNSPYLKGINVETYLTKARYNKLLRQS